MECNPYRSCSSTETPFEILSAPRRDRCAASPVWILFSLGSGRVQSSGRVVFALTRRAVNIDVPRNCCCLRAVSTGNYPPSPLYAIARKGEEGGGRLHLRFAATERPGQFYRYCGQPFSVEHGTFPPDETAPRHGWIWMITERFFRGESKRFRCCSIGKLATKKESTTTAVGIKRGRLCRVWRAIKISAGVWFPTTDL